MRTLWLIPDGAAYARLHELIEDLSTTHGTPVFEPHVTLLSGIQDSEADTLEKAAKLAKQQQKMHLSLTQIKYLEFYYRCLFFTMSSTEVLMQLRQQAEKQFKHTKIQPFIPHVSFLYGSLPVFKKEAIIETLGDAFYFDFVLSKLRVVETSKTPEHWKWLGEFDLQG